MKNSLRMMLPVALLALGTLAASADEFVVDGLRYETLSDNTVEVSKYVEGTDIVIPATVTDAATSKQYDVVAVGYQAFYGATGVKTVSIPASVKDIGVYSFWKCGVETVTIAEGLEKIGHAAFKACTKLTTINLPSTLTELGYVFDKTGFDGNVFIDCTALKTIDIPGSVERIAGINFGRCTNLETVTLHEGTTTLGERAFEECTALKSIELPESVTTWERGVFQKSGLVSPVIPGRTKIIPNSAFWYNKSMTSFTIEEGVEEIGKGSFSECDNLTQIKVPNSVEWIRSDAFQANANVTEIYLGSGVRRMGNASLAVWQPDQSNVPHWALKEIHIASPVPPVHEQNDDHLEILADDFFFGEKSFPEEKRAEFYSQVKLYVPAEAIDEYKAADVWREFVNILPESKQDGIEGIAAESDLTIEGGIARAAGAIEVYTVSGVRVANAQAEFDLNTLGKGLYIVKSGNKSLKTIVK